LNTLGEFPVPTSAYYMSGTGGQYVWIIPSHDLVVVRLGFSKGAIHEKDSVKRSLSLLMEAIKTSKSKL